MLNTLITITSNNPKIMTIYHNKIKNRFRALILPFAFVLLAFSSQAQTYVGSPMTGTPTAGEYYSYSQITLSAGFTFTASAGQSLHLYIAGVDCLPLAATPSSNQNYIRSSIPRVPTYNPALSTYTSCDVTQTIQYFDGLGRPIQTVQVKGSPGNTDIVQPMVYDQFGRQATQYLAYALTTGTSDGSYKTDALTAGAGQAKFYNPTGSSTITQQSNGVVNTSYPSATTVFEPSPLNRVTEQGAPGLPWQPGSGHTVKVAYSTNATGEVIQWMVNAAGNGLTGGTSYYTASTLNAITTTDENGFNTVEYKDKEGKVVCKKAQATTTAGSYIATYYVYDNLNNLRYVIPPPQQTATPYPANILETDLVFTNFIYGYHYDERNRLIQKKVPGKGLLWEYMVYNKLDQLVLSQDAVQRAGNQWTVVKYDALGRVIMTGLWNAGSVIAQSTLQASIYAGAQWDTRDYTDNVDGYAISSYPLTLTKILTLNYYDDYKNIPGQPIDFAVSGYSPLTKGLLTATKTAVLNSATDMLCSAHYYDDLGRNVKTYQQHYLGGTLSAYNYDVISTSYNFANQDTAISRQHYTKNAGNTAAVLGVTVANSYAYDHMGRKTQTFEKINTGSNILLSQTDYNPVGQVTAKHLHGATGAAPFLQDISYKYNERGWLKRINDPALAPTTTRLFSEQLNYDSVKTVSTPKKYNGNITEQLFQAYGSVTYPGLQQVVYTYDPLNRLNSGVSTTTLSETGISYDNLGNITSLKRGTATAYGYTYNGNQLSSVSGVTTSSYVYDVNGNANHDGRTGATLTYNLLNLPQTAADGANINLTYTYDAGGQKLRKVSTASGVTTNTDYISGIQYTNGAIAFIQTEEGRAINSGGNYTYEYTLTDHLGNNRVTFDPTNGKVGEEDYYPFGLNTHRQQNAGNKYLYNKKEIQEELGQYDFSARFYDPVIGRWNSVDPLAEGMRRFSPYVYCGDNPIRFVDPDGMFFNEYNVVVQDGQVKSRTMTGTKGGDVTDYVTVVNLDEAPYASGITKYTVDVQTSYTSGPPNDYGDGSESQKRHPTPGFRLYHGSTPTDIQAYFWLTAGLAGRGAAILKGAGAFAPEAGVKLTQALSEAGGSKSVAAFLGWGDKTIITKTAADFTKKQLLEAGYTKEVLHEIYSGLVEAGQKTIPSTGVANPASVARAQQVLQILKTHF